MSCNISGLKKEKCYGCYACYNICPLNAIDMLEDEEGFEYPKVNEEKCINCKRCLRACPSINPPHVNSDTAAYACYAKNQEEHMSSSSGGIFAIIEEYWNFCHKYPIKKQIICKKKNFKK